MAKKKQSKVIKDGDKYRLQWNCDDGCVIGCFYHETIEDGHMWNASDPEDEEEIRCYNTMLELRKSGAKLDYTGFYFSTKADANKASGLVEKAHYQKEFVVWPEWAIEAVAHGFKPPKGWKPEKE